MAKKQLIRTILLGSTIALSANLQYGFSSTYLNDPVDHFKDYLNKSFTKWGSHSTGGQIDLAYDLLSDIWMVGFFFGIWLSPVLNDRFGRKVGFIIGNAVSLLASCLRALAIPTYQPELLFAGRFLASVVTAVTYQAAVLYLNEVAPTEYRGVMSCLADITYSGMCLVGMFLGTDQILGRHLVWLLAVPIPLSAIALVVLFFLPETPKFLLIVKRDRKRAEKSVKFYQGADCAAGQILDDIQMEAECQKDDISITRKLLDIFTVPHLRKAFFLSCAGLQNTLALWTILLNSTQLLQDAGVTDYNNQLAKWSSTAMALFYFIGGCCSSLLVERAGRRPLLLWMTLINMVTLCLFVLCAELQAILPAIKYGCVFALIFYGFTYGAAVGPVSWFLPAELVPQRYRSLNQSLSYAVNTIAAAIFTFSVMPLYGIIGSYAFLVLYIGPSIFCILYQYWYLPETANREIYDIVAELRGSCKEKFSNTVNTRENGSVSSEI